MSEYGSSISRTLSEPVFGLEKKINLYRWDIRTFALLAGSFAKYIPAAF